MSGRGNKHLIIRLQKSGPRKTVYHIVVTRKKTDGQGRQDSLGRLILINENMSDLKIDINKLNYYLHRNVSMSTAFVKILGIERALVTQIINKKYKNENNCK